MSQSSRRSPLPIILAVVVVIVVGVIAFVLLGQPTTPPPAADATQVTDAGLPPAVLETSTPAPTPVPFLEIVIAVQEIPRGVTIEPNMVALVPYPETAAPIQVFSNIEDVVGLIARTDIYREQPVLQSMVVPSLSDLRVSGVGSDAAAVLPDNRVAVAVPMNRLTSVAYAIQPGDRVDVIVSFLYVDVDPEFQSAEPNAFQLVTITCAVTGEVPPCPSGGTFEIDESAVRGVFDQRNLVGNITPVLVVPSEQPRPRLATQRTITDALVIWRGDFPLDGRIFVPVPSPTPIPPTPEPGAAAPTEGPPPPPTPVPLPDIVTLAVSPQDAVVLTWLVEARVPVTFALRSAAAVTYPTTETVSLNYIMQRFSITPPEKFEYNIEPAIRSIRQLNVGDTISLNQLP